MVDSRDVAADLKERVFPLLREAGFSRFKSRAAWRRSEQTVEVVDFHSLGSYLAGAVGATSHSFGGNIGIYYLAMHRTPWAVEPPPESPSEAACHARRFLRKSVFQLWCWRPDVWYVNRKGGNLSGVLADVQKAVVKQALPWLEQYRDLGRALSSFEARRGRSMAPGITLEHFGGGLDSFARAEVCSALALACGQRQRALAAWERMLRNPYYKNLADMQAEARRRMSLI